MLCAQWNGEISGVLDLGEVLRVGEMDVVPSAPEIFVREEVGVDRETMPYTSGFIFSQTRSI